MAPKHALPEIRTVNPPGFDRTMAGPTEQRAKERRGPEGGRFWWVFLTGITCVNFGILLGRLFPWQ